MDALCDPRAFLSAQEKRAEQLKALGIEETDISSDVIESKGKDEKAGDGKGKDGKPDEIQISPKSILRAAERAAAVGGRRPMSCRSREVSPGSACSSCMHGAPSSGSVTL